jgi:acyl-CoA thioesterase-1
MRSLLVAALVFLAPAATAAAQHTIVFFGDSITAGFGLDDPGDDSYPAVIQARISAAGLPWRAVNAGLSGETTSGGLRRVDWILRQPVDVFVLALGGNDGLRGIAPSLIRANLEAIIERVRARRPSAVVVLAGMRMPTNMGEDYTHAFAAVFPEVAARERTPLIPFLLDGVGGRPELNQGDGMHPTAAGDLVVADNVWRVVRPLLGNR